MRFENPDTGEILEIDFTVELLNALEATRPRECQHTHTEVRARTVQGGGVQIKHQCLECGLPVGNPLRKAEYPNAPPFDEELLKCIQNNEQRSRWRTALDYQKRLYNRELSFQREYDTYLKSDQWLKKRLLILRRCGGYCEGCMEQKATEVHHLTYKHFGNELLFELVALCRTCHDHVHGNGYLGDPEERPCRGCRFQSGDGEICPIFGVSEEVALADENFCGPARAGFQPLK